jgi:hypothetical protein
MMIRRHVLAQFFKESQFHLIVNEKLPLSRETFLQNIKGVDAVILQPWLTIDKEALDSAGPSLKVSFYFFFVILF